MKNRAIRTICFLLPCAAILYFPACRLQNNLAIETIDYDTRTVEFWTDIDPGETEELQPVITKIYDSTGFQIGEFADTFDDPVVPDVMLKTKTDIYEVSQEGEKTLHQYVVYTYDTINYNGEDIFRLIKGETFDPGDARIFYYDLSYTDDVILDSYTLRESYAYEGSADVLKSEQRRNYLRSSGNPEHGKYRTEQFFDWDGADYILKKEYAAWYNSNGEITKELYHVKRGSQTVQVLPDVTEDASYFYVTYSRDTEGNVYLQNNFVYTDTVGNPIPVDAGLDDAFLVTDPATPGDPFEPFVFDPDPAGFSDQVDMLLTERDPVGNISSESLYSYGNLQEKTIYTYDEENRMTKQAKYSQGGQVLEDSTEIRYRDEYIDDIYYLIREVFTYTFNETYSVNRE